MYCLYQVRCPREVEEPAQSKDHHAYASKDPSHGNIPTICFFKDAIFWTACVHGRYPAACLETNAKVENGPL